MTPSSECFAQFSRQVEQRQKGKVQGRGVVQSDDPSTGGPCKIPLANGMERVPPSGTAFASSSNGQQTISDRLAQAAKASLEQ